MTSLTASVMDAELALPTARTPGRRGAVATAAFDQDVVTLAVDAGRRLLDRTTIRPRALVFATVSSPFAEGGVAQTVAEALDVQGELLTAEQGGTVAAGGTALLTAAGYAAAGHTPVLVIASDVRRDASGRALGDGAIAALVASNATRADTAATFTLSDARTELVRDRWRRDGAAAITDADRSFGGAGATEPVVEATLRVDASGPAIDRVGVLGCPATLTHALLGLVEAKDGDLAVVGGAGGVSHHLDWTVGPHLDDVVARIRSIIADGTEAAPRQVKEVAGFDPYVSQPRSWRERGQDLRLAAQRDPVTGEILFPALPPASAVGLEQIRLARTGTVYATTRDHVYPYGGPMTMAVIDLDDGGRFYAQVADDHEVMIGTRVELVLRRLHDGGGLPHHYHKVVPLRATPEAEA